MVSFRSFFLVSLVGIQAISGAAIRSVHNEVVIDERGFLGDIVHDVTTVFGDIFHIFQEGSKDIVCAFDQFTGNKKQPNTNGIEWYEDADYVATLLLTNSLTEYAENKTLNVTDTLVKLAEKEGINFLKDVAKAFGVDPTLLGTEATAAATILNKFVVSIIKTLLDDAGNFLNKESTAKAVDSFINKVIAVGESLGVKIISGSSALTGAGIAVGPAISFACTVGGILSNGATSLEACTLNVNPLNQVLSEFQILFSHC
ncbi:Piso0_003077 [Millerozyma farinosa CBS 7064]|uniref:Piso0_003077 protein n=1 Tax=Pichia sorbitophila (strain ATCC MYA-4447 / BCRC 22081 / CBS 7064 / NBRC 10061 / NRRL Y-12695) TaxID=559304 RepID=G8YKA4_PICSO|nr:Piso0_003077 [Millerozyma farinosa CBS 7064]CCE80749.1 Piso0_003077 [Millerozyma farinosa CBS 7064]